jgi:hypothetical protein
MSFKPAELNQIHYIKNPYYFVVIVHNDNQAEMLMKWMATGIDLFFFFFFFFFSIM